MSIVLDSRPAIAVRNFFECEPCAEGVFAPSHIEVTQFAGGRFAMQVEAIGMGSQSLGHLDFRWKCRCSTGELALAPTAIEGEDAAAWTRRQRRVTRIRLPDSGLNVHSIGQ